MKPIESGHAEIGKDQIRVEFLECELERFARIDTPGGELKSAPAHLVLQQFGVRQVILDDQDSERLHHSLLPDLMPICCPA